MNAKTSPRMLTPIYQRAAALGAKFVDIDGWHVPDLYSTVEAEVKAAQESVALADGSANTKILVEGEGAETLLKSAYRYRALKIGTGAKISAGILYRLRNDRFFISAPPEAHAEALEALQADVQGSDQLITVSDLTHGRAELHLIGPTSPELLSGLCGLDFSDGAFPDLTAKSSSLAKTSQLILRHDLAAIPTYAIVGARSLGAYLWDTILEAGSDLGIAPIGQAAIRELQMSGK